MDSDRRKFIKMAGLSAVAGIAAPTAFNMLLRGDVSASTGEHEGAGHEGSEHEAGEHGAKPVGKRYGMVIDIKKFGENPGLAQKCVQACHSLHNVPDYGNKKDEIKWIWAEHFENTFPAHSNYHRESDLEELPVMTLCNHCDNPPCVRACPTQATFKAADGIVKMDYHRCIGCRFCMAACPYGARSFNWRDPRGKDKEGRPFIHKLNKDYPTRMRGVVEKCTFCTERLAVGLQPACVDACGDTKAMVFGDLNDANSELVKILRSTFTIQRKPSLGTNPSLFYVI